MAENNAPLVCLLAAGRGGRIGRFGEHAHKGLVPVGDKPAVSWIIDQFPVETRFVVALGHKAGQIRDFLRVAYPERDFVFQEVDRYEGPGSGPGYSLRACREHLRRPFIFTACDTLITDPVPPPDRNWMGAAPVPDPERWCAVTRDGAGRVASIHYREKAPGALAFVGIAGVADVDAFWDALEHNREIICGEYQVVNGLKGLMGAGLFAQPLRWYDTGDEVHWREAERVLGRGLNTLGKSVDMTYRLGGHIVKFFADPARAANRARRGVLLGGLAPEVSAQSGHFLRYPFVEGEPLSRRMTPERWSEFLNWCRRYLWTPAEAAPEDFRARCLSFYRDKTRARLDAYCRARGGEEEPISIDGVSTPSVGRLLEGINWKSLELGPPARFHGDLHPDNVLVTDVSGRERFKLLDLREDFAGELAWGDPVYDLAKLNHTLILTVEQMEAGGLRARRAGGAVFLEPAPRPVAPELAEIFWDFCREGGFDLRAIRLVTALIFVNMAPLYEGDLSEYLYWLGRRELGRCLAAEEACAR